MRKRTRYSLLLMLGLVAALAIVIWLRKAAPPEVARLLPESDAILYANLKPLRAATHFDRPTVARSPDYQRFIDATGIVVERDVDAVAFALHRMDDPRGPNGPVAYSEVFEGRFDGARLRRYLDSIATAREDYEGHIIFTVPVEGRQLRIAQLGYDTVAASNMPTPEQIHAMLDRYRAAASPFAGSSLLAAHYRDVPLLSSAWGIGHVGLPFSESGRISVFGLALPLPEDTTFVASLTYGVSALRLRVEQIAPTEVEASRSVEELGMLLQLLRGIQGVRSAKNPGVEGVRQFVDSIKIEQHKDRAVLTASLPFDLARRLTASENESGPEMAGANSSPATRP
jgi:hypothetical protein